MNQALIIYTVIQSLFFTVFLISDRKKNNNPLILYFVFLFFQGIFFMLVNDFIWPGLGKNYTLVAVYEFIELSRTAIVFSFLYSIIDKSLPFKFRWLWALPVLNFAFSFIVKKIDNHFYQTPFYENWYLNFPMYVKILFVILLIWQLKNFKKEISENTSRINHYQLIKLYWGKYFIYFNIILSGLLLIYIFVTLANGRLYSINSSLLVYSETNYNIINKGGTAFFLLIFGYMAFRNQTVFNSLSSNGNHIEQTIIELVLPEDAKIFQNKIGFTEEQTHKYDLILNKLLEIDKIYLDPELSLNKLSKLSGISPRQLSQFIQFKYDKKYKDFIVGYRVEKAKEMLSKNKDARFTMYAVAFDSGFNSESAFYKIFKEHTGFTPKQYQDKCNIEYQNSFS